MGKARHLDMQRLVTGGIQASALDEADDALLQTVWLLMPQVAAETLALRRDHIEQVDAENCVFLCDPYDIGFLDEQAVAGGGGGKGMGEALVKSEDALRLQDGMGPSTPLPA